MKAGVVLTVPVLTATLAGLYAWLRILARRPGWRPANRFVIGHFRLGWLDVPA
jgi:hypothetical protein